MAEADIVSGVRTYVAGEWVDGDRSFAVENPADESLVAEAAVTPLPEIDRAIDAARTVFDGGVWADRPAAERAAVLRQFLDHIEADRASLVATIVAEAGQPRAFAERAQSDMGLTLGRQTIDLYLSMVHEEANPVPVDDLVNGRVALSIRRHEPVGVVAAITPYNGAVIMAFQKLIPALMAGNSVILRPSPLHPSAHSCSLRPQMRWGCRRGCSTSLSRTEPRGPNCSPPIPGSTWSPSPDRRPWAGGSWRRRRRR